MDDLLPLVYLQVRMDYRKCKDEIKLRIPQAMLHRFIPFLLLLILACLNIDRTFAKSSQSKTSKYKNICGSQYDNLTKRGHRILGKLLDISDAKSLTHKSSPQHQAMCWIIYKDPARLSPNFSVRLRQRYAAAVLYYATGGGKNKWKQNDGWLTKRHECRWYGVQCNYSNQIIAIDLASNNLSGVIPPEIGDFKKLISLQLYSNELFSALPSRIGDLKQLQELMLQINSIGGTLPPSIGNLTNLRELRLYGNYMSGTIPNTVGNLKSLELFDLFSNRFIGLPPQAMSNMRNLEELYLDSNDFQGKILEPKSLPTATKNVCSLKTLKIFSADCARTKTHPAEIECPCCTRCCNDYASPRCISVAQTGKKETKKSKSNSKKK